MRGSAGSPSPVEDEKIVACIAPFFEDIDGRAGLG